MKGKSANPTKSPSAKEQAKLKSQKDNSTEEKAQRPRSATQEKPEVRPEIFSVTIL
jgi:hypothetical protein